MRLAVDVVVGPTEMFVARVAHSGRGGSAATVARSRIGVRDSGASHGHVDRVGEDGGRLSAVEHGDAFVRLDGIERCEL